MIGMQMEVRVSIDEKKHWSRFKDQQEIKGKKYSVLIRNCQKSHIELKIVHIQIDKKGMRFKYQEYYFNLTSNMLWKKKNIDFGTKKDLDSCAVKWSSSLEESDSHQKTLWCLPGTER